MVKQQIEQGGCGDGILDEHRQGILNAEILGNFFDREINPSFLNVLFTVRYLPL